MNFNYRENINKKLNLKNLNKCIDLINLNKYEFINKGLQGEIFKVQSDKCGSVVIKKKINHKEDNEKWKNNLSWLSKKLFKEYEIMKKTNYLINEFICPNYIQVYNFNSNIPLIIMEYADGDARFLFNSDVFYPNELYNSLIFQVLAGIYYLHNNVKLLHNDLNLDNVFYKKINPNIIFHYKINKKDYYLPTFGYLFMLGDYGRTDEKNINGIISELKYFGRSILIEYLKVIFKLYKSEINLFNEKNKTIFNLVLFKEKYDYTTFFIHNINSFLTITENINNKMNKYILKIANNLLTKSSELEIIEDFLFLLSTNNYKKSNIIDFIH